MKFNKEDAFDELTQAIQTPLNPKVSDTLKAVKRGQDFLEKIYLDAYQEGLERGIKKVESDDSNI